MTAKEKFISFYTMVRKDFLRIVRIWPQTFLPAVITSTLYFTIFGKFLGGRIGELDGVPYIMFVVPGLVMLAVVTNSYANTSFSMFSSKFFGKNIEEILVSPTPSYILIAGFVASGLVRGIAVGLLVLLTALFFTKLVIHNFFIVFLFLILTTLIFSLAGLVNGVYAKTIDGINIVPTFILTPLVYLGGVFYSISILPAFWQNLTLANPIFYIINGFRYGFLGASDVALSTCIAVLLVLSGILVAINLYLLKTGLGLRQ